MAGVLLCIYKLSLINSDLLDQLKSKKSLANCIFQTAKLKIVWLLFIYFKYKKKDNIPPDKQEIRHINLTHHISQYAEQNEIFIHMILSIGIPEHPPLNLFKAPNFAKL